MPLTSEYPRYTADARFGLTASPRCNVLVVSDPVTRHRPLVVAGAGEDAIVWNPVTGLATRKFREEDDEDFADEDEGRPRLRAGAVATRLAWHAGCSGLAIGYSDGWIRLYNLWTGELLVKFCGHKNAIAALAFDAEGAMLAAGGQDADVTLLRVEGESGFRLQGHSNCVTQVQFLDIWPNCLATASKDGLVKFWNLELRVCFKTLTGHPGEVWDFALLGNSGGQSSRDVLMVTGSCDNQLRLWRLTVDPSGAAQRPPESKKPEPEQQQPADLEDALSVQFLGSVAKATKGRTHSLSSVADPATGRQLLCVSSGVKGLEWFAAASASEQRTRLKQRQKKATRKGRPAADDVAAAAASLSAEDILKPAGRLTGFPAKLRCAVPVTVAAADASSGGLTIDCFVSLANNSVMSYRLSYSGADGLVSVLSQGARICHGHEGAVRWAAVSSDGLAVLTLSSGQLKLWHFASLACLLTVPCPDAKGGGDDGGGGGQLTRCIFLPGDRYAAAGTADGRLLLCDLNDGGVTEQLQAHSGPVTSLCQLSNATGLVTGSSQERQAMQWRYEIASVAAAAASSATAGPASSASTGVGSRLSLLLSRSIALDDCLASVCHTPDSRLLCCGLLDNSIRVLFCDSVRQFLHLHGHSQPASALAASADSATLASGSGDRTIRLWGLQFGDCQKVLRGHELAIAHLLFVPAPGQTRLLVSAGADRCLRVWDAGKFRRVAALHGHQAAVACVAASPPPNGDFLVSVDADGSVRSWRRCEEPLVLEEQREMEKEAQFEEEMAEQQLAEAAGSAASGLMSRLSLQSVRGAEGLLSALERWEADRESAAASASSAAAPSSMAAPSSLSQLAYWLGRQPLHELEQAVSALPAVHARRLLAALKALAAGGLQPERICRCACLLLSFHFPCLAGGAPGAAADFQARLAACGDGLADLLGFNLAGLRVMQGMLDSSDRQPEEAADAAAGGQKKRRKQQQRRDKPVFDLRTC